MTCRSALTAAMAIAAVLAGCVPAPVPPAGAVSGPGITALTAAAGERRPVEKATSPYVGTVPGDGTDAGVVPGEVIVGLADGAEVPLELGALGAATIKDAVRLPRRYALLSLPEGASVEGAIEVLGGAPGVLWASPNRRARARGLPPTDDLLLPAQWAYEPGVSDVYGAWSLLPDETESASRWADTVVAVVDTGVDPEHPDLDVLPGFWTSDFVATGSNYATASFNPDVEGHGTGVAGIVGAKKGNTVGAAGVVPGIKILPIRIVDDYGDADDFAIIRGLLAAGYYNRDDSPYPNLKGNPGGKVRVINLSYGPTSIARSQIYDDALEFLRQRGILVCVAAGNFGVDGRVEIPANSPAAVGVSASMQYLGFETLAPYSSHGPEIWVAGPGNYLWSTWIKEGAPDYSKAYVLFNGTSSAAPFVAGVAAAINLKYGSGGPDQETAAWTDAVKRRLADTADDLGAPGFDYLFGYGRVNARRALEGSL